MSWGGELIDTAGTSAATSRCPNVSHSCISDGLLVEVVQIVLQERPDIIKLAPQERSLERIVGQILK